MSTGIKKDRTDQTRALIYSNTILFSTVSAYQQEEILNYKNHFESTKKLHVFGKY